MTWTMTSIREKFHIEETCESPSMNLTIDFPQPDAKGNYPAVEYAKASLARKIIRDRVAAGLTQRKLAELAGISFEHLCRIETGKHTPTVATIDKIQRALDQVDRPAKPGRRRKK
jgi:DNA-binding XRE family transcriptional regulator